MNGFFQSEGSVTCLLRIRESKYISLKPVINLTQLLDEGSLKFFITLWYELGCNGTLSINKTNNETLALTWSSESWDLILKKCSSYFNMVHGEKYAAFLKLRVIRGITKDKSLLDERIIALIEQYTEQELLALAVRMAYEISNYGAR